MQQGDEKNTISALSTWLFMFGKGFAHVDRWTEALKSRAGCCLLRGSPPTTPFPLIPNHSLAPTVREHILMYVLNPFCPSCSMLSVIVSATDERNYIFLITFRERLNQKKKEDYIRKTCAQGLCIMITKCLKSEWRSAEQRNSFSLMSLSICTSGWKNSCDGFKSAVCSCTTMLFFVRDLPWNKQGLSN